MGRLDGRVAIVTGAAQGIGREYARALAAEGAAVAVADLQEAAVKELADELAASGRTALAAGVDVADAASTEELAARVEAELGGIDILVNNAALYSGLRPGDPFEIEPAEWDRVMAVNVRGPWLCARAVVPAMRRRGYGRIVNQASIAAWGGPSLLHYSVSKAAVVGLTRSLAKFLGGDGITVNTIAPGQIGTESTLSIIPADRLSQMAQAQAVHRTGDPADLCGALVFLCSDEAGFMTGQTVIVDGGLVMP